MNPSSAAGRPAHRADAGNRRARLLTAVAALLLLWAGFAYHVSGPVTVEAYRRTLSQVTAAAYDVATTTALIGRQQQSGHIFAAFATNAYDDDAAQALAGAQEKLAGEPPPDLAMARWRDRVAPLLHAVTRVFGEAATAGSDAALRHAVAALENLATQLDQLRTELEAS